MSELTYKIGEDVYAKWPGSKFWYRAKVMNNKGSYKVQFEDGSVESINVKQVRGLNSFRHSPSRGSSPGRGKRTPSASPSRRKGHSRSRSPTHSTKERRKSASPGRPNKGKGKQPTTPKRSPSRQSARVAQLISEKEKPVEEEKSQTQLRAEPLIPRLSAIEMLKPHSSSDTRTSTIQALAGESNIYATYLTGTQSRTKTVYEQQSVTLTQSSGTGSDFGRSSETSIFSSPIGSTGSSSGNQGAGELNLYPTYLTGTESPSKTVYEQQSVTLTQSSGTGSVSGRRRETSIFSSPIGSSSSGNQGVATFQQDWKQDMNSKSSKGGKVTKTAETEFGGPIGAFILMFFMPAVVLLINLACSKKSCTITKLPEISLQFGTYFDWKAILVFIAWFIIQAGFYMVPIGKLVDGQTLQTGSKLKYRCNAFLAFVLSIAVFGVASYFKCPVTYNYDNFLRLAVAAILFCIALSTYLYVKARKAPNNVLAPGGNTGNMIYDFFMGHELNPRIGSLDLKFFCELRPGLIGWALINLAIVAKDCEQNSGKPNPALLLVAGFQIFYVADSLWFEDAILTTMDIIHEGFGFMLAFGDIVWVPFLFSLQPRFLQEYHQNYPYWILAAFFILNLIGYIVFRGSNSQKNSFRKNPFDPTLSHLKTIPTAIGKPLLASGWWGFVRHPNYLGDLIMAIAWCIPCGINHILPYFYVTYFLTIIIHRALRDEKLCKKKYGVAWDRYCERVKYRMIPYIF